jgi:hypothetical protein
MVIGTHGSTFAGNPLRSGGGAGGPAQQCGNRIRSGHAPNSWKAETEIAKLEPNFDQPATHAFSAAWSHDKLTALGEGSDALAGSHLCRALLRNFDLPRPGSLAHQPEACC